MKIDKDAVSSLANILKENDLTEIEYEFDSVKIRVARNIQQNINLPINHSQASAPLVNNTVQTDVLNAVNTNASNKSVDLTKHDGVISSKMVGTVYLSPGPGAKPYVSINDHVEVGQTIYIVEAMKVMNMIKAPKAGIVKHIFVKDTQPVEYGDPILIIE